MQCGGLTWARIRHDQALRANLTERDHAWISPARPCVLLRSAARTVAKLLAGTQHETRPRAARYSAELSVLRRSLTLTRGASRR
jgi:hypothetical protein